MVRRVVRRQIVKITPGDVMTRVPLRPCGKVPTEFQVLFTGHLSISPLFTSHFNAFSLFENCFFVICTENLNDLNNYRKRESYFIDRPEQQ